MRSIEQLVYKRMILDMVVAGVIAYRNGDRTSLSEVEAFVSDVAGRNVAREVLEVVKKNIDSDIPTLVDKVSKTLDEVMG